MERTLVILKPDAYRRRLMGKIIARLEDEGLAIDESVLTVSPKSRMSDHYGDLDKRYGDEVKRQVVEFMCSGPIMVMVVSGDNAVQRVRDIVGATDPAKADPGTIRRFYGQDSFERAKAESRALENLIHASASVAEAGDEIGVWFATGPLPSVHFDEYVMLR